MNEIALESFISYCDNMMIANESMKSIGNNIMKGIKKAIEWIINKIKELKRKVSSLFMKLRENSKKNAKKENEELRKAVKKLEMELKSSNTDTKKLNETVTSLKDLLTEKDDKYTKDVNRLADNLNDLMDEIGALRSDNTLKDEKIRSIYGRVLTTARAYLKENPDVIVVASDHGCIDSILRETRTMQRLIREAEEFVEAIVNGRTKDAPGSLLSGLNMFDEEVNTLLSSANKIAKNERDSKSPPKRRPIAEIETLGEAYVTILDDALRFSNKLQNLPYGTPDEETAVCIRAVAKLVTAIETCVTMIKTVHK